MHEAFANKHGAWRSKSPVAVRAAGIGEMGRAVHKLKRTSAITGDTTACFMHTADKAGRLSKNQGLR